MPMRRASSLPTTCPEASLVLDVALRKYLSDAALMYRWSTNDQRQTRDRGAVILPQREGYSRCVACHPTASDRVSTRAMSSVIPDLSPRGERDAQRGVIAFALLAPVRDVL